MVLKSLPAGDLKGKLGSSKGATPAGPEPEGQVTRSRAHGAAPRKCRKRLFFTQGLEALAG